MSISNGQFGGRAVGNYRRCVRNAGSGDSAELGRDMRMANTTGQWGSRIKDIKLRWPVGLADSNCQSGELVFWPTGQNVSIMRSVQIRLTGGALGGALWQAGKWPIRKAG